MRLFIKNMVSGRCKNVVKEELTKLGLPYQEIELGHVDLPETLSPVNREQLNLALKQSGLELMTTRKSKLIEKIKNVIVQLVHYTDEQIKTKFSIFLSDRLGYDYTYLANVFSTAQGITIDRFRITHKIERVKELLEYNELNLTEIAHKLHYSSVAHLSNQFKKITGLTPSRFKQLKDKNRTNLESM